MPKFKIYIVDDDSSAMEFLRDRLIRQGHEVATFSTSRQLIDKIAVEPPDIVFVDVVMPEFDGLEVCRRIKQTGGKAKVIVTSNKAYDTDRRRALELGADAYLIKPVRKKHLLEALEDVSSGGISVDFWGVRGTLPVSGPATLKYGGNTSCVSVKLPKEELIIFDAGTGIKSLSDHLIQSDRSVAAKLFISHAHWDHINALPFFSPLYQRQNRFGIFGPRNQDISVRKMVSDQMDSIYSQLRSTSSWLRLSTSIWASRNCSFRISR